MTRYDNGWDFMGRSDEYLRDAFDLWALTGPSDNWYEVYQAGMRAIIEECYMRALEMNKSLAERLESLLVSETPVHETAVSYTFLFIGDSGAECYIEVSRDYSRNPQFGEWEIESVDFF